MGGGDGGEERERERDREARLGRGNGGMKRDERKNELIEDMGRECGVMRRGLEC